MGNTFGTLFRVTTWGESHGGAIGAVVDGCPSLLPLSEADIQPDLDRRAPGQSRLVTQRKESDTVRILSGVFEGRTLGTPIGLVIPNEDSRSADYSEVAQKYRPSHADYTYQAKFGIRDWRGGGRTSARETAGRVAAGAIARKLLAARWSVEIVAFVSKVGRLTAAADPERVEHLASPSQLVRDGLSASDILRRLVGDDLSLLEEHDVRFRCRCSRERVAVAILAMGRQEIESVLADDRRAEVTCEFCTRRYVLEEDELRSLL